MSLRPIRRRADQFARLLDTGGRTGDPVLAPMLTLAGALQALPAGPRPDFRDSLRQRLVAVAAVQAPPAAPGIGDRVREWASSWHAQRRLAVAAGGLAAVTAVAGVGLSASRSLPGEPFYAVKTAAERMELVTTTGDLDRGKLRLAFARTRLREVDALASGSALSAGTGPAAGAASNRAAAARIVSTLRAMDRETREGTTDLTRAWHDTGSTRPITILTAFAQHQAAGLAAVLPELPSAAQAQADQSLALLRGVTVVITQMQAASCGGSCTVPGQPSNGGVPGRTNGKPAPGGAATGGAGRAGTPAGTSITTAPGAGGVPLTGTGSTSGVPPQTGSSSAPLPIPKLSPVPAPTLSTVPLQKSSVPLPTSAVTSILPKLPLSTSSVGLP